MIAVLSPIDVASFPSAAEARRHLNNIWKDRQIWFESDEEAQEWARASIVAINAATDVENAGELSLEEAIAILDRIDEDP